MQLLALCADYCTIRLDHMRLVPSGRSPAVAGSLWLSWLTWSYTSNHSCRCQRLISVMFVPLPPGDLLGNKSTHPSVGLRSKPESQQAKRVRSQAFLYFQLLTCLCWTYRLIHRLPTQTGTRKVGPNCPVSRCTYPMCKSFLLTGFLVTVIIETIET